MRIYLSKKYLLFNTVWPLIPLAILVMHILAKLPEGISTLLDMLGKAGIFASSALLVGVFLLLAKKWLAFLLGRHVLIDEAGVHDHLSLIRFRRISWEDIDKIAVLRYPTHDTLLVISRRPIPFSHHIGGLQINKSVEAQIHRKANPRGR